MVTEIYSVMEYSIYCRIEYDVSTIIEFILLTPESIDVIHTTTIPIRSS